jgi:hypothetical protein
VSLALAAVVVLVVVWGEIGATVAECDPCAANQYVIPTGNCDLTPDTRICVNCTGPNDNCPSLSYRTPGQCTGSTTVDVNCSPCICPNFQFVYAGCNGSSLTDDADCRCTLACQ